MDPNYSGQDVIRCTLCKFAVAPMCCENCQTDLCKDCVEKHLTDESKVHKVVSHKQFLSTRRYPTCSIHSKRCELYCDECDFSVCAKCVSSKHHKNHNVADIMEYYDRKLKIVKKDLQELKTSVYLKCQEFESSIIKQREDLKKNSQILTALKAQGEIWHREIDNIINKMQFEIDDIDSKNLSVITKQESIIQHKMTEISQMILGLKTLLDSDDVSGVSQYKSRNAEFRELPSYPEVSLPNFQPEDINLEQLIKQFGNLSTIEELGINDPRLLAKMETEKRETEDSVAKMDVEKREKEATVAKMEAENREKEAIEAKVETEKREKEAILIKMDSIKRGKEARKVTMQTEEEGKEATVTKMEAEKREKEAIEAKVETEKRVKEASLFIFQKIVKGASVAKMEAEKREKEAIESNMQAEKREKEASLAKVEAEKREKEARLVKIDAEKRGKEASEARIQAEKREKEASLAKIQAEKREKEASLAKIEAEKMKEEANLVKLDAGKRKKQANVAKMEAEKRENEARMAKLKAEENGKEANVAKMEAEKRKRIATYVGFFEFLFMLLIFIF